MVTSPKEPTEISATAEMTCFSSAIAQTLFTVDDFELESGIHLRPAQVAYKTWGSLNDTKDNVMIICHAFTGSADVEDWSVQLSLSRYDLPHEIIRWGPLMGPGKAFDPTRYFIFCANVLGSPYGTSSPVTVNPHTGKLYGPEFPPTTIRDDVMWVFNPFISRFSPIYILSLSPGCINSSSII
jgi:homoserine O-acetyltransferase/O-succinyltransferase